MLSALRSWSWVGEESKVTMPTWGDQGCTWLDPSSANAYWWTMLFISVAHIIVAARHSCAGLHYEHHVDHRAAIPHLWVHRRTPRPQSLSIGDAAMA